MCVWYSLKPLKPFSFDELKTVLFSLAKFHYDVLGYKKDHYNYHENLHLDRLKEQFRIHQNHPEIIYKG
jgi:hypothetical protein